MANGKSWVTFFLKKCWAAFEQVAGGGQTSSAAVVSYREGGACRHSDTSTNLKANFECW